MVADSETFGGALEDVAAFCAVVELGSISAAARRLGESKGGISRRVSRLERRLGTRLLARTARAVTATEEGMAFYAKARDALKLLEDAAEGARQSRAVPRGHLRVTAPHDLGLDVLPELIVAFRAAHPQITVELLLSDAALDLAAHRIDLALRATSGTLPDTGYRASLLIDLRVGLYASPGYLAAHPAPQVPEELERHELVASHEATGGVARLELSRAGRQRRALLLRPVVQVNGYAGVHRLVQVGGGIGAIPDLVAAASLRAGALVPVLPGWVLAQARLHAISVAGREAPARVRVFRDFMRAQLRQRVC